MDLTDCKLSSWYLVVTCPNCQHRQAILRDPSQGKADLYRSYLYRCDVCDVLTEYEPEKIERYHHVTPATH